VNAEEIELFVATAWEPRRAVEEGVPSADLFLLGRLDRRRLATEMAHGHLLRVRVTAGGAVDVTATGARPPSELQHLLAPTDVFLLPAAWLERSHAVAGLRVEDDGHTSDVDEFADVPLTLRCMGARHGAKDLPNDVERWPQRRLRAAARMYALISDSEQEPLGDWVELHRRKPSVRAGRRLVELSVGSGRGIDVVATAARLAPLTSVRSRLPELRADGVELILPSRSYSRVMVVRTFEVDGTAWRQRTGGLALPLSSYTRPEEYVRTNPGA
jgi:hypothetical protein